MKTIPNDDHSTSDIDALLRSVTALQEDKGGSDCLSNDDSGSDCLSDEALEGFRASVSSGTDVIDHLTSCSVCRARLVDRGMRPSHLPTAPSPRIERVMAAAGITSQEARILPWRGRFPLRTQAVPLALAALLLLALGLPALKRLAEVPPLVMEPYLTGEVAIDTHLVRSLTVTAQASTPLEIPLDRPVAFYWTPRTQTGEGALPTVFIVTLTEAGADPKVVQAHVQRKGEILELNVPKGADWFGASVTSRRVGLAFGNDEEPLTREFLLAGLMGGTPTPAGADTIACQAGGPAWTLCWLPMRVKPEQVP